MASALVGPMFTIAIFLPCSLACKTILYPENTDRLDPRTNNDSLSLTNSLTASTRVSGTLSPKNVISGLSIPPHESQWGGLKLLMFS